MAMKRIKCCVGGCCATSDTHRLFNFPKDDNLRQLWLSFVVPTNPLLSGLSREQLIAKRVCQKHFDRYQFTGQGNRLQHGYPSLFSPKEIQHGIPLPSSSGDHLTDHNYNLRPSNDVNEETVTFVIEGDHNYTKISSGMILPDEVKEITQISGEHIHITSSSQLSIPMDVEEIVQLPHSKKVVECHVGPQPNNLMPPVNATAKYKVKHKQGNLQCKCFISKMKKVAKQNINICEPFPMRYAKAQSFSQSEDFRLKLEKLPPKAYTFLQMQIKCAGKKKKALRFTTEEKLLSLSLMKESPKGYRLLQKIFKLPNKRTLNRVAENVTFESGLNDNIFKLLERKVRNWDIKKKLCSIIFDEVALTPHLTYVESKDKIYGFKDLGENNQLRFTDHALVFMLRGICSNWRQPVAYYFCEGTVPSYTLIKILKELVQKLNVTGLIPIATVCDQGSTFRMAIKKMRADTERKRMETGILDDGTIDLAGVKLNIIFDPPHLLKGIRNNFLTKNMIFEGKIASWVDILTIYKIDCQLGHTRMLPKLTEQHVVAEKIKKMKVRSTAAQALSARTSAMLKYTSQFKTLQNGESVSSTMTTTAAAVAFFAKLFDSVNGSKSNTCKGKIRGPVKQSSKHIPFWIEAIKILKNIKYIDSTSLRAVKAATSFHIRVPSLEGWITSLQSFERISTLLFNTYGIQYFYPRNVNQDPLENFFGRIRAINYRNVNPDSSTFINAFKSLILSNVMGPHSNNSNCEDDEGVNMIDFFKLLDTPKNFDKENIEPQVNINTTEPCTVTPMMYKVINEKFRVHSSAYTAGYICRKMTKKIKCNECTKTFTTTTQENIHEYIHHREYQQMRCKRLAYPTQRVLIIYREISDYIHSFLNNYAHHSKILKGLTNLIINKFNVDLGCIKHKKDIKIYFITLIIRLHVHNWCNIINKILRGALSDKNISSMPLIHQLAFSKYKSYRLRNKKKV